MTSPVQGTVGFGGQSAQRQATDGELGEDVPEGRGCDRISRSTPAEKFSALVFSDPEKTTNASPSIERIARRASTTMSVEPRRERRVAWSSVVVLDRMFMRTNPAFQSGPAGSGVSFSRRVNGRM